MALKSIDSFNLPALYRVDFLCSCSCSKHRENASSAANVKHYLVFKEVAVTLYSMHLYKKEDEGGLRELAKKETDVGISHQQNGIYAGKRGNIPKAGN